MAEAEQHRVQRLTRERGELSARLEREGTQAAGAARIAVNGIADQRVTRGAQMHADLMRAARRQAAFDERSDILESAEHAVTRDRRLSALAQHGHLLAVAR